MGFLIYHKHKSGDGVSKALCALADLWRNHAINWERSPYISFTIKALKKKYPTEKRAKRPFTILFVWFFFRHFWHNQNFRYMAILTAILFDYAFGLRPGEATVTGKDAVILKYKQAVILRHRDGRLKELIIYLHNSKTNQSGHYLEQPTSDCRCNKFKFGFEEVCPLHVFAAYHRERCRRFGIPKPNDPLLINEMGRPLQYGMLNDFLYKGITKMSEATGIPLDTKYYTPHCLRVGGATDLARSGVDPFRIEQFGRWRTTCWANIYIQTDFIDLARLRGTTVSAIRDQFKWRGVNMNLRSIK